MPALTPLMVKIITRNRFTGSGVRVDGGYAAVSP